VTKQDGNAASCQTAFNTCGKGEISHTVVGREFFKRVLVQVVASDCDVNGLTNAEADSLALVFHLVLLDQLVKDLNQHMLPTMKNPDCTHTSM